MKKLFATIIISLLLIACASPEQFKAEIVSRVTLINKQMMEFRCVSNEDGTRVIILHMRDSHGSEGEFTFNKESWSSFVREYSKAYAGVNKLNNTTEMTLVKQSEVWDVSNVIQWAYGVSREDGKLLFLVCDYSGGKRIFMMMKGYEMSKISKALNMCGKKLWE